MRIVDDRELWSYANTEVFGDVIRRTVNEMAPLRQIGVPDDPNAMTVTTRTYGGGDPRVMEAALMRAKTLFEVFVVNRKTEDIEQLLVLADGAEDARIRAVLHLGVDAEELSNYHVSSREVARIPLLDKDKEE